MTEKTLQDEVDFHIKVSERMIADMVKLFEDAIKHEDWRRASELSSYIDGMRQILVVFETLKSKRTDD